MRDPILAIPDELQKHHLFVCGGSGSGKSTTARGITEFNLWKGRRVCVVDPTGNHWGLKSSRDGKKPGFAVTVFGGEHADIPIDDTMGGKIGEILATTNTPAVIDLQLFSPERTAKFLTTFFENLYRLNREVLHVVLDEAHRYIPQQPRPYHAKLLHHVTDMVTGGRSRGFKFMTITQRPARIHKDPVAMSRSFILHETSSAHDRKAIGDMMEDARDPKEIKTILGSLPSMPTGEAWVWSPKADIMKRVKFPLAMTFDSGAAPEDGETKSEPTKLAFVDLDTIKAALAPKPKPAKENPRKVNFNVAMDKALTDKRDAEIAAAVERERARLTKQFDKAFAQQTKAYERNVMEVKLGIELFFATLDKGRKGLAGWCATLAVPPAPTGVAIMTASQPTVRQTIARRASAPTGDTSGLSGAERKFLNGLAWWREVGFDAPTRAQLAAVAGYPVTSGSTKNALGSLRSAGLIDYPGGGTVSLTADGEAMAEQPTVEPTNAGIRAAVDRLLDKATRGFLDAALSAYPDSITREDAAETAGYPVTSGSTKNALGALRTMEFIDYPGKGMVRAAEWFFPQGT